MLLQVLKPELHRAVVTDGNVNDERSPGTRSDGLTIMSFAGVESAHAADRIPRVAVLGASNSDVRIRSKGPTMVRT